LWPSNADILVKTREGDMTKVQVFDPAMCCSTGICGPSVDPKLVRFAADLDWLSSRGVNVERYNLSQQPAAFAADADVKRALETKGENALPLIKIGDAIKSTGRYASRAELAEWTGIEASAPVAYTDAVAELVAIGAAVASNCEPCFKFHFDTARKLGVSMDDMLRAVKTAQAVKETSAKSVIALAERFLGSEVGGPAQSLRFVAKPSANGCAPAASGGGSSNNGSVCCSSGR
jgi:AhpD family alkylhydroperoxidase